jgi:hypothetical protein
MADAAARPVQPPPVRVGSACVDEYTGKDLGDPVRYLAKVLVSWKKNGGPPEVPPVRVANGTAAKPEKWDPEEQRAYYAARYEAQEAEAARKAGA